MAGLFKNGGFLHGHEVEWVSEVWHTTSVLHTSKKGRAALFSRQNDRHLKKLVLLRVVLSTGTSKSFRNAF
jgi:hypothetical protein